jgi:hypothetical protein
MMTMNRYSLANLTREMPPSQEAKLSKPSKMIRNNVIKARIVFGLPFTPNGEMEFTFWRLFLATVFNPCEPVNEAAWKDFMIENELEDKIKRLSDVKVNVAGWNEETINCLLKEAKRYGLYAE